MPAFIDATCPHCSKRFGWRGERTDPPLACPSCGKDISADKELVKNTIGPQPMTADGFFKARRHSGLSFTHAAHLLNLTKEELEDIEEGRTQPDAELMRCMAVFYQVAFISEQREA